MKKSLIVVCLISIAFATTAIATETYTEKFVNSKTQKIVKTEKKLHSKNNDIKTKINTQKELNKKIKNNAKTNINK